jgi:hypothetical protein
MLLPMRFVCCRRRRRGCVPTTVWVIPTANRDHEPHQTRRAKRENLRAIGGKITRRESYPSDLRRD